MTLSTEQVAVADLRPYYRNPRKGNVAAIAESLRENGQYRAIVVNRGTHTGRPFEVLAGNHTAQAAASLGWATLDAHLVDVEEDAAARIVLADNRTSDQGEYDNDALLGLLQELDGLAGTGYDETDLEDLMAALDADLPPAPAAQVEREVEYSATAKFTDDAQRINPARRLMVLDLSVEAFAWMVEHLERVAAKHGVSTNIEAIAAAVSADLGVPVPHLHDEVAP